MKRIFRLALPAIALAVVVSGFALHQPATESPAPAPVVSTAAPVNWSIDKGHSRVGFKVRHLGITNVNGSFGAYDATISLDPADLRTLKVNARADVNSIDTGIERRDGHLKSEDFFDAANHPQLTFVSKGVSEVNGKEFKLAGDLTMRGVTKPVVFDVELVGPVAGPGGKPRVGLTATARVNRFDYGLKWDNVTEAGGLVVAQDVDIVLDISAVQEAPAN